VRLKYLHGIFQEYASCNIGEPKRGVNIRVIYAQVNYVGALVGRRILLIGQHVPARLSIHYDRSTEGGGAPLLKPGTSAIAEH
jgi:hypothetical protein